MTPERVEEIYKALGDLVVSLDPDPAARGPKYLQDLISRTRGYLNEASTYLSEVLRERNRLEMQLDALEAAFAVSADDLLANDRRVSTLPAIQDRQSMINVLLSKERREIQTCKREIKNLGHVERAVRHRHKELDGTMSAIRLQRSLIESELRTGAFYGDESDESRGAWGRRSSSPGPSPAAMEDIDESELARLVDAESALVDPEETKPKAAPEASPEAAKPAAPAQPAPAPKPAAPAAEEDPIDALLQLSAEDLDVEEPPRKPKDPPPLPVTDPDKEIANFLNEESDDLSDLFSDPS